MWLSGNAEFVYSVCEALAPSLSTEREGRRMSEENDSVGKVLAAQAETFI